MATISRTEPDHRPPGGALTATTTLGRRRSGWSLPGRDYDAGSGVRSRPPAVDEGDPPLRLSALLRLLEPRPGRLDDRLRGIVARLAGPESAAREG